MQGTCVGPYSKFYMFIAAPCIFFTLMEEASVGLTDQKVSVEDPYE
jgi:hypothetical protein